MRKSLILLLLSALVALPLSARGFRGERAMAGPGGPFFDDEMIDRMADRHAERLTRALDLTADQQTTLARLQDELAQTVRPLFDQMRSGRETLESMLDAASPDATAIGNQAIAMHRLRGEVKAAHDSFDTQLKAMLNPTQRAQFDALQEVRPHFGREGHRGGGPGPGGPGGPPPVD